ncbi:MAG: endolytic transglycosylase MltG [Pseudomonadota bacterium]
MRFLKALFGIVVVLAILGAAAGGVGWVWFQNEIVKDGPLATDTVFSVTAGETLISVASRAETDGIISDDLLLRLHARFNGEETAIKVGEFSVPAAVSTSGFLSLLVAGDVIQYTITLPEGLTTAQILNRIDGDDRLLGELPDPLPVEGSLLPETYAFTRDTKKSELIDRMTGAQETLMDNTWPDRADNLPISSRQEALTLASIVQKEAAGQDEYGNVASVFINRLERGMKLETDVSVHYGVNGGEPLYNRQGQRRTLYRSELDRDTPYNTYTRTGLPPTPIANPGADAIQAVLNPPETDYIFFVASGTTGSVFSTNYRDHQRAVADYRAYERAEIERERSN